MDTTGKAKASVISDYRNHETDTGSPEVQIALLTGRITELTEHMQRNKKDHAARRGLLKMVSRRTSLLGYLTRSNRERYRNIIAKLGLRK